MGIIQASGNDANHPASEVTRLTVHTCTALPPAPVLWCGLGQRDKQTWPRSHSEGTAQAHQDKSSGAGGGLTPFLTGLHWPPHLGDRGVGRSPWLSCIVGSAWDASLTISEKL